MLWIHNTWWNDINLGTIVLVVLINWVSLYFISQYASLVLRLFLLKLYMMIAKTNQTLGPRFSPNGLIHTRLCFFGKSSWFGKSTSLSELWSGPISQILVQKWILVHWQVDPDVVQMQCECIQTTEWTVVQKWTTEEMEHSHWQVWSSLGFVSSDIPTG